MLHRTLLDLDPATHIFFLYAWCKAPLLVASSIPGLFSSVATLEQVGKAADKVADTSKRKNLQFQSGI